MNTSFLNYHLATARAADLEREARRLRVRALDAEARRRPVAGGRPTRRAALVARVIG